MIGDLKKFKVIPDVPEKLSLLYDIAYNIWLCWNPPAIKLFTRMDAELWDKTRHNPVKMLGEVSQTRLDELAKDEGYVVEVKWVHESLQNYLNFIKCKTRKKEKPSVAYFSLEYGLTEALPIYSGGLGVLAGDHIKSSSDQGINLNGIGLLYQTGYFRQYLNQDGWQQDYYDLNDFHNMPLSEVKLEDGNQVVIDIQLPGRSLFLNVWKLTVGRVTIYLLDSNNERNSEKDRKLTAQLYGGDREMRLQQEIILGMGGVKLLDRLDIPVEVVHMNEGHSSFAVFERARRFMRKHGLSFNQALEVTRKTNIFTTHTPVPAGNDEFVPDLVRKYFQDFIQDVGISMDEFLSFGRVHRENHHENFSMPVLAIKYSSFVNGVSQLHAEVARGMWRHLWKDIPEEHVPIEGITNGVHLATWLSFEMNELFRRYLGDNWQEQQDKVELWKRIDNIPDPELWRVHSVRRRRLIYFIRERLHRQLMEKGAPQMQLDEAREALDPETLTIGFARRFATYKRGNLIFRDIQRLLNLLDRSEHPVQFIFAGKAHPQDHAGKEIIKDIIHHINDRHLIKKVVFIEDYDMNVARYMVQGVDVWLNNPLRPHEASGTSGMKASGNGVLNLSILDGWWDEAYDFIEPNGWAIGSREAFTDRKYQDEVESKAIYSIIEKDIIPIFYEARRDGLPREWIKMMKNAFVSAVSFFNTHRMIKEYSERFYEAAGKNFEVLSKDDFKATKELVEWKNHVRHHFHKVSIGDIRFDGSKVYKMNDKLDIEVDVFTGELEPGEIKVDVYLGNVGEGLDLVDTNIENLSNVSKNGGDSHAFSGKLECKKTGNFAFKIRVTPYHPLIMDPYEMNLVHWK